MENEATSAGLHLDPRNEVWKWEEIKHDEPIESLKGPFWWFLEKIRLTRSTYNVDKLEETTSYELFWILQPPVLKCRIVGHLITGTVVLL
jgi:hypothetical protein